MHGAAGAGANTRHMDGARRSRGAAAAGDDTNPWMIWIKPKFHLTQLEIRLEKNEDLIGT